MTRLTPLSKAIRPLRRGDMGDAGRHDVIETLHGHFKDRVNLAFGWGTLLINDFRGLAPNGGLDPFSLVCKVVSANGNSTVKLSDNPNKAMGDPDEIARYKRVFGVGEQEAADVVV